MKRKSILLTLLLVVYFMLSGCADKPGAAAEQSVQPQAASELSLAEQKEKAYDIFKEILELTGEPDRQENLPKIKELYREIIEKYPEVGLAQESYLRLIIIAKDERSAAGDAEAERLYQEYVTKYPDSNLRRILENEVKASR